jgi:ankyrin repeat protein
MDLMSWTMRVGVAAGLGCLCGPHVAGAQALALPPAAAQVAAAAQRSDEDAVRRLVTAGADVNEAQKDGMTALHWAAFNGDEDVARLVLQAGGRVGATTRLEGVSPLQLAAVGGRTSIVQLLLEAGAPPDAPNSLGVTPLMQAASAGSVEVVRLLLDRGADPNVAESARRQTPLMFAAAHDRAEVIRLLVQRGARLDALSAVRSLGKEQFDEDGNPIPAEATSSRTGRGAVETTTIGGIASGAPKTMGGLAALHYAARDGYQSAAKALVEAGADVNLLTRSDGSSPLVIAISNGHYDLASYLLGHGADPNVVNNDGLGALYAVLETQWAPATATPRPIVTQEHVGYLALVKALLDKGADPNARLRRKLWFSPLHANSMWVRPEGATPFWRAAQACDLDAMRLLVAHGANPHTLSDGKDSALHMAVGIGWAGNFSINAPDGFMPAVRYLVEEIGLDVNAADVRGYTPLMGAAWRGDNEMVEYLVARGADLQARSGQGWVVTDFANAPSLRSSVPLAHPETIALLLKLGAPALTKVDDEEILGIIRRKIPEQPLNPTKKPGQ